MVELKAELKQRAFELSHLKVCECVFVQVCVRACVCATGMCQRDALVNGEGTLLAAFGDRIRAL